MAREQSPIQKQAFQLWINSGRTLKPAAIAAELDVNAALVRKWKHYYKWDEQEDPKPKRRGAQHGNKNGVGNKGGAPPGNENAVKHGMFRKFLPDDEETLELFDSTAEIDPLDVLWMNIRIAFTNIIRAQKIQHVTGKDEMIKELKKRKYEVVPAATKSGFKQVVTEEEFEFQFAWDRQGASLTQQAAAMANLTRMIKQYDDMLRSTPPDEVKEEQRLRVSKLKAEVDKAQAEAKILAKDTGKTPLRIEIDYGDDES